MKAIAPPDWWRHVVEEDMQYVSFIEEIERESKAQGREEAREEAREAMLALAAQIAAPILVELQKIDSPKDISRRLAEYLEDKQR